MSDPKNESTDARTLHDEELTEVAGGISTSWKKPIYCTTFSYCGYFNEFTQEISYCPCSKCQTPMYKSELSLRWTCDCCGNAEFFPVEDTWLYSREELISTAIG